MAKKVEKKSKGTGFALLFCIGAAYLALSGHVISPGNSHSTYTANDSCRSLERLWVRNGGSASKKFMAAEIAMAESSGNENATHYNNNGTVDRGIWQINSIHGSLSVYDPNANARAAVIISSDGTNWYPWTTYRNGAYIGRCLWYPVT